MFQNRYFWRLASLLACLCTLLAACDGGGNNQSSVQPSPTVPPAVQYSSYKLQIPQQAMNAPIVGNVPDTTPLHLTVSFKPNEAALKQLDSGSKQSSTTYTSDQLAKQIGISDQTYQQIKSAFALKGMTLTLGKLHTDMTVDTTTGVIAPLLQTQFVYRQLNGRKFYTPKSTQLQLPAIVVDNVVAVTGLDSFSAPPKPGATASMFRSSQQQKYMTGKQACGEMDPRSLSPQQVAHAYGLDSLWQQGWTGKGMTINLVELEGFDHPAVQHYLNCVGYNGNLRVIDVDKAPVLTGNEFESLLDIEMIAGLAPDININVYETDGSTFWNGFYDTLQQIAVDNQNRKGPGYISISWFGSETQMSGEYIQSMDQQLQTLERAEHMTIFNASGDCGPYGYDGAKPNFSVTYPTSSPFEVGVGGTQLLTSAYGTRSSEVAWRAANPAAACGNTWGTGGGLSVFEPRPQWQTGFGVQNQYSTGKRQVPDLAADATNLSIYFQNNWGYGNGTSAAAPITATMFALINQGLIERTGYYVYGPSVFYTIANQKSQSFYDVQEGNNLYYPATPGWDYATGLGVLNVPNFYNGVVQYISAK